MRIKTVTKCAYSLVPCSKCPVKVKKQCVIVQVASDYKDKAKRFEKVAEQTTTKLKEAQDKDKNPT